MRNPKIGDRVRLKRRNQFKGAITKLDSMNILDVEMQLDGVSGRCWYSHETLIRLVKKKKEDVRIFINNYRTDHKAKMVCESIAEAQVWSKGLSPVEILEFKLVKRHKIDLG